MERLIKRYQNRKLYDTVEKQYIKLADIRQMIRDNLDVKIIDNVSGNDITHQILIQLVMRAEQEEGTKRVPLEGLKDLIQNDDSPVFQAFRGVMSFGRDVVNQIGNSVRPDTIDKPDPNQLSVFTELLRKSSEKITDSAVKIVNGTLAREMLKVPTRDDWTRLERKFDALEKKLSDLDLQEGE